MVGSNWRFQLRFSTAVQQVSRRKILREVTQGYLWDAQPRGTFDVVLFKERKGIGGPVPPATTFGSGLLSMILRLLGDGEETDGGPPSPTRDK